MDAEYGSGEVGKNVFNRLDRFPDVEKPIKTYFF